MARISGSSSFVYGVDFGMTTSSLAIMRETGELSLVKDPAILGGDSEAVPTAVCVAEPGSTDLLVGQAAVNAELGQPMSYRDNFKRDVGRKKEVLLDDRPFAVVDLISAVLRFLFDQAQALEPGPPAATVLTVPADWAKSRRDIITSAAITAGYPRDSLFIADEPTASIEYARSLGIIADRPIALVYDLGGSTLDCAAVRPGTPGLPDPRATAGREIGGIDFDLAIRAEIKRRFPAEVAEIEDGELGKDEPWRLTQLQHACEVVKRRLSNEGSTREILYDLPGRPELLLSRDKLETLIIATVDQTIEVAQNTLAELGLNWDQVEAVLPIGGSTRIPLIQHRLAEKAPGKVLELPKPDFAPALGAAVMAQREAGRITAGRQPLSADLVTANPWSPRAAVEEPSIAGAAKESDRFNRAYPVAVWLTLVPVLASTGFLALMHWELTPQIIAALWCFTCAALAVAFTWAPSRNSVYSLWLCGMAVVGMLTFLGLSIAYWVHTDAFLGSWDLGTALFLLPCAFIYRMAGTSASRARVSMQAFARNQAVIQQVSGRRWFGTPVREVPEFLNPLFDIPALRGFHLRTRPGEEQRYALAAGNHVLIIAMLTSRDQRPLLEQLEGLVGYPLPPGSVRTILVAPGVVPPRVPANEQFESATLITTERGLVDIVGRWLERDNRLLIPLLSALLRSVNIGPDA
jgi:molecular chaperone DnaK